MSGGAGSDALEGGEIGGGEVVGVGDVGDGAAVDEPGDDGVAEAVDVRTVAVGKAADAFAALRRA